MLISLVADLSRAHLVIVGSLGTWALLLVLGSLAAESWREHGAAAEPSDEGGDPTPSG